MEKDIRWFFFFFSGFFGHSAKARIVFAVYNWDLVMLLVLACQLERPRRGQLLCPSLPLQPGLFSQGGNTFLVIPFSVTAQLVFFLQRQEFLFCHTHLFWVETVKSQSSFVFPSDWMTELSCLGKRGAQIKQLWVPVPEFPPAQCSVLCGGDTSV